ncbi:discoidin domain-containing protein [Paenibacillus alba]|uniref:discoidin domain-containing protein n=1 Tax=Paenibacillus alba TaxID=1197127 RepID=UPI0015643F55|nr:discoidin domain-containing protein [Paenibacillus alba]NQX67221.1 discoidin domain-containing protein [Paenibacillus alba]
MRIQSTAKWTSLLVLIAMTLIMLVPATTARTYAAAGDPVELASVTIPHKFMTATATSQNAGYEASKAIDGNQNTLWHTKYSNPADSLPQSMTIKLNRGYQVNKFRLLPRQNNNTNGRITNYNLYVSVDGINYQKVANGTWSSDATEKVVNITPAVSASYVKLEALSGGGGFAAAAEINIGTETTFSLAGEWGFKLGNANGTAQGLIESVKLPGTLDENKKGAVNSNVALNTLSRKYTYTGPATYQKKFTLPASFEGKRVELFLERTRVTKLWVNNQYVGTQNQLTSSQVYDITDYLGKGENIITIEVSNSYTNMPKGILSSHMATEHTQTNWNGILGSIEIQAHDALYMDQVRVYPDVDSKMAKVKIDVQNTTTEVMEGTLTLSAKNWNSNVSHEVPEQTFHITVQPGDKTIEVAYKMGDNVQLWDEFNPALYNLRVVIEAGEYASSADVDFGMRSFKVNGAHKQFAINGKNIFLRSEANCAVFPLTGYAPMDEAGWEKLFSVYKSYGINHVRFHSWSPPEAAFKVADRMGLYLQPELSQWDTRTTFSSESDYAYYTKEAESVVKQFANHPSFVMYTWGNELQGDRIRMNDLVEHMKTIDSTRLYAEGSNTWYGREGPGPKSDFFTAQQWGSRQFRGAYAGSYGHVNDNYPSTMEDYTKAMTDVPMPLFSFEVGQFEVYPDFTEIPKYTGVLEARNFKKFQQDLENAGMLDQADQFVKASGQLSQISYREEIEAALRTPQFAGISLLGLQDFPGQGTALVGMVNALGESKSFSNPNAFKQFNNAVVPLVRMEKMTWQNNERYTAKLQLANYGPKDLTGIPYWTIKRLDGTVVASGELTVLTAAQGGLRDLGNISADLSSVAKAAQLTLEVGIKGSSYINLYDIWVYPAKVDTVAPKDVLIVKDFNAEAKKTLKQGGKVLIVPDSTSSALPKSVQGAFMTDFWSYPAFKVNNQPGTMGLLIDTDHQALKDFPTNYFSNWQWWPLAKNGRPTILDDTSITFRPIVQVIDNFERNHKLGLLFEANVDNGKLMVSSMDLLNQQDKPEVRQMLHSILRYMGSDAFNPEESLNADFIQSIVPGTRTDLAENKLRTGFPEPLVSYNTTAGYNYVYDRKWQLVDGKEDYTTGTNSWTNWTADPKRPQDYIGIDFGKATRFDRVELDVFTDFDTAPPGSVTVQYWNGSAWVNVSHQQNGAFVKGPNLIQFDPVESSKVKLTMTAGISGGKPRGIAITELRVYDNILVK